MLELSFIIALTILFLHACTREGMIFSFIPEFFWNAPVWIKKPLYDCPVCMAPWWGSVIIFFYYPVLFGDWPDGFTWLILIAVSGGINVVLASLITEEKAEQ